MTNPTPSQSLVDAAVSSLRAHLAHGPSVGLILGSGLGRYADRPPTLAALSYREIPGFHPCSVEGHAGKLIFTDRCGPCVAILQGRIHRYEGYSLDAVTLPVRVLAALGVKTLIVTCAAGALTDWPPGTLMVIQDHLNLMGDNPLAGSAPGGRGFGGFVEMAQAYDPELRQLAERAAGSTDLSLKRGILAAVAGPSYETAAEAVMLERLGAQAVSMSVVPEVIVARQLGLRVIGLALITNKAGAPLDRRTGHHQVVAVAESRAEAVGACLDGMLKEL
jgi:purine-nucleoside phosphorylase